VSWEAAVVSWASAWARLGIKPRTGARYARASSASAVARRQEGPRDRQRAAEGDRQRRAKHGVTNATIRRDMTAISSVLGHCVDEGWIEENPAHMMDRSRFKERKAKIILPRPDSIAQVFAERSRFIDMAELSPRDRDAAGRDRRPGA
jgi:integrase/recombinase XerD